MVPSVSEARTVSAQGTVEAVDPEPPKHRRPLLVHWEDGSLSWVETKHVELAEEGEDGEEQ